VARPIASAGGLDFGPTGLDAIMSVHHPSIHYGSSGTYLPVKEF